MLLVVCVHNEPGGELGIGLRELLHLIQPIELVVHSLNISSSIGVAVYPQHGAEEKLPVKSAGIAMYHAKKNGRNNVKLYQPGMQEIIQ